MKHYITLFFISLIIATAISPLRGGYISIGSLTGLPMAILAHMIIFFIFTLFALNRNKHLHHKLIAIILGSIILELPFHIIAWGKTLFSFLDLPCRLIAILTAYYFFRWNSSLFKKYMLLCCYFIFCIWVTFYGFYLWQHKIYYGSYSGKTTKAIQHDILFTDTIGKTVNLNSLDADYILLDFWYSKCGSCLNDFPLIQKLYNQTHEKKRIALYSVHCISSNCKENYLTGYNILREKGYKFPILSINSNDPYFKTLNIDIFPTILIFNHKKELIFRGSLEFAEDYLQSLDIKISN